VTFRRLTNVHSNKDFCWNGISLRVETRIALPNEKHLVDKTIKFSLALFKNAELALKMKTPKTDAYAYPQNNCGLCQYI